MFIREDMMAQVNKMEDRIIDYLGWEEAFKAISKALDVDTKNSIYEYIIRNYEIPLYEFGGYKFDPNGDWTDIWYSVIEPIIDEHFGSETFEDDVDAIINMFMDEFGEFDSVRIACEKFFDENYI